MTTTNIDHLNTPEIVCPHCGYHQRDSWEIPDGDVDCSKCERPFEVRSYTERVFTTSKAYRCDICNSNCSVRADGTTRPHWVHGTTTNCPGGKAVER